MKTYADLWDLLRNEAGARDLFASLPMAVRTQINDRPNTINSIDSLKSYVDNVTKGDG